jgi:hypothetical protein
MNRVGEGVVEKPLTCRFTGKREREMEDEEGQLIERYLGYLNLQTPPI